ncbi:hypothetical protein [Euzebya sp.]|uniref:hypothetical protein n=1 Tax=Euzebya sp. TaxID=1971409 RepID=UPI003515DF30
MSDFSDALEQRLSNNADLAERRRAAEEEMDKVRSDAEAAERALDERKRRHHGDLAAHLQQVADQLKASRPESFIVRSSWTESGEEFVAKMTTRQMRPKRSLFIEVDRDDDEVLARWTSDVGSAIEIWRLLQVTPEMLTEMVLQVADDVLWAEGRPPAFPAGLPAD